MLVSGIQQSDSVIHTGHIIFLSDSLGKMRLESRERENVIFILHNSNFFLYGYIYILSIYTFSLL